LHRLKRTGVILRAYFIQALGVNPMLELEGFPIFSNKIEKAKDWMAFLKTNQKAVNRTLINENMVSEQIFSLTINNTFYLCWYSQQTKPSQPVQQSTDPVDIKHVQFWNECVDNSKPTLKFKLENSFTPT
jgi:hypothetical protein